MSFREYVEHGWALCGLEVRQKGPPYRNWQRNPIAADAIDGFDGAGLIHALSGTCAIDIDALDKAIPWSAERGVALPELLGAPEAVRIESGTENRSKLLFALSKPLRTVKPKGSGLELRCEGAHDVLPPSIHPSGRPYRWVYPEPLVAHWSMPPPLPAALLAIWREAIGADRCAPDPVTPTGTREPMPLPALRKWLEAQNPNAEHDDWLKVGMKLHDATGGSQDGFDLWDSWSTKATRKRNDGSSLYPGESALRKRWNSFSSEPGKHIARLHRELPATADEFPLIEETAARPVISLAGGELHNYAARCEEILADSIYVRERQLVRIAGANELAPGPGGQVRRDESQAVTISATSEYIRRELNRRARFQIYRRREKEWVSIDCPKDLALNIAGQGDWPTLRRLTTIARAPFMRPDGSICETPGYDTASCVFYLPNADFPPVPSNPTRDDAKRALVALLEPFEEFPFATEAARNAFVAHILTEIVRAAINMCPAFFYTAPIPGTGKTLLSEIPSRIVHGCGPALRPWAESGEELRKALFSSLLAGDRTIGFDNLPNGVKVRSPILCVFLTADTYSDRRLGASDVPTVPNRSVVSLTGNNITPAGDLARRSIVSRLDPNATRLRDRRFRIPDLRAHVAANRPALLIAALTILRAHALSGSPGRATLLPSFESWSRLVRNPLLWLDMADPVTTQDEEGDDEAVPLAEAFRLMVELPAIGEKEFTASELAALCDSIIGNDPLIAAIEAAGCGAPSDQRKVGYWLREKRDRIAGGIKLVRGTETHGVGRRWRLRRAP